MLTEKSLRQLLKIANDFLCQEDKQQHLVISGLIVAFLAVLFGLWAGVVVAGGVGLAKEIWDHYYGSGFSVGDLFADALGIGLGGLAAACLLM